MERVPDPFYREGATIYYIIRGTKIFWGGLREPRIFFMHAKGGLEKKIDGPPPGKK